MIYLLRYYTFWKLNCLQLLQYWVLVLYILSIFDLNTYLACGNRVMGYTVCRYRGKWWKKWRNIVKRIIEKISEFSIQNISEDISIPNKKILVPTHFFFWQFYKNYKTLWTQVIEERKENLQLRYRFRIFLYKNYKFR